MLHNRFSQSTDVFDAFYGKCPGDCLKLFFTFTGYFQNFHCFVRTFQQYYLIWLFQVEIPLKI